MSELKLRLPKEEAPTLEEPETKGLGPIRRSTERDERDPYLAFTVQGEYTLVSL